MPPSKRSTIFVVSLVSIAALAALPSSCGAVSADGGHAAEDPATSATNRYLQHIFSKYGSRGTIGFEGLEHLMQSLRLGGVELKHGVAEHRPKDFRLPEIQLAAERWRHRHGDARDAVGGAVGDVQTTTTRRAYEEERQHQNASGQVNGAETTESAETKNTTTQQLHDDQWLNNASIHDVKHRHVRHFDKGLERCLSPADLLHMAIKHEHNTKLRTARHRHRRHAHGANGEQHEDDVPDDDDVDLPSYIDARITHDMFVQMCPLMLLQLDQRACSMDVHSEPVAEPEIDTLYAWIYASVSIVIISMCGLAGVAIVPLTSSDGYQNVLQFLVALAVGTLCGDALMHLLPHALLPHQHDDDTSLPPTLFTNGDRKFEPVWLCFCAFLAALGMFAIEATLQHIGSGSDSSESGHRHTHSHSHSHSHSAKRAQRRADDDPSSNDAIAMTHQRSPPAAGESMLAESLALKRSSSSSSPPLSPVAFMVLLGDGLHNITDGMAIGAAFAAAPVTGAATALAVLCHELPHELGDFALLLQTGVSLRRALAFNVLSSVLSVLGMCAGLLVAGSSPTMVRWIYAGTAGTFVYIALADLVPEMRSEGGGGAGGEAGGDHVSTEGKKKGAQSGATRVAVQVAGVLSGGLLMLAIAMYEEKLKTLFE